MTGPAQQPGTPGQPTHPTSSAGTPYGGFGTFEQPGRPRRRRIGKPHLIGAAIGLVLAAAGGVWLFCWASETVYKQQSLESEVVEVLREHYGEPTASKVSCPADEPADPGHTFTCSLRISGQQKVVQLRVLDDNSRFAVGAPR